MGDAAEILDPTNTEETYDYAALEKSYLMARAAACTSMPYLESLIIAMGHTIDKRVLRPIQRDDGTTVMLPTAYVTKDGKCMLHPAFIQEVIKNCGGTQALAFIIAHEAMHLLFKHSARMARLQQQHGDNWDNVNDGLASDLSINPSLLAISKKRRAGVMGITMPTGHLAGVTPEQFGLKEGLTYEQYYQLLCQQGRRSGKPKPGQGNGNGKGKGQKGQPDPSGQPGQGCSPDGTGDKSEGSKQAEGEQSGISETRLDNLAKTVMQKAKEYEERNRGSVPAGILSELDASTVEPKVRWQDVLRAQVFHAIEHRNGADDSTWNKNSRRQGGIGYGPGHAMLPGTIEYRPTVGLIRDTSGSMGSNLQDLINETMGIIDECGGEIDMIDCDTEATDRGKVSSLAQVKKFSGGGGTDMTTALDIAKKKNVDIVVCITDGYIGTFGGDRGYKLIWCIVPGGSTNDVQPSADEGWATVVKMEDQ